MAETQSTNPEAWMALAQNIAPLISLILGGLAGLGAASLRIGRYAQIIDGLQKKSDSMDVDLKSYGTRLTICETKIEERTASQATSYLRRKSPVELNDRGELLLKKSGADKYVLERQAELVALVKARNPKTAYDVQQYALEVVETLKDRERFLCGGV